MNAEVLDLADVPERERPKAAGVLERVRLRRIVAPGPDFDAVYALLDSFFGERGEMEPKAELAGFVAHPVIDYGGGREGVYFLLAAYDGEELVGARDCYVDLDHPGGACVVALAHSLVVPAWRRSGLAAVMRAAPLSIARAVVAERMGRPVPILVAAEMEPADPHDLDTVVRLLAYGRSGFGVLDPQHFRYSQPEFRTLPAARHTGIPLLGVVRALGMREGGEVPARVARAFPELFHACHDMYLPLGRVEPSRAHCLRHLGEAPVRVLPLPTGPEELGRLAPFTRGAVLPLYPEGLRGPEPGFGAPAAELAQIVAAWAAKG